MKKFEEREWITLENHHQKIFGILHKPLVNKPCPVVFLCHGFAGNKCGRHRIYVNLATALSQCGIATMRLDFRGCGDSEGELIDTTIESQVSDAMLGLKHLEGMPDIDSSRIGILGRSLGGAIAVLTAERYAKAKSLVLWSPVYHAHQWAEDWEKAKNKLQQKVSLDEAMRFNNFVTGEEFVKQLFVMDIEKELKNLDSTPLLHIHGEKDMMVKIEHADHYNEARKNAKGQSHFVRIPNGDHDFSLVDSQRHAIEETCKWFQKTL